MTLLSQDEGVPASYPAVGGLPVDVEANSLWQRIESWIAYRWGERSVTWIVEGPGTFEPPLKPATIDTSELWDGSDYQSVTLKPAPIGYELAVGGTYRIVATVGSTDDPPAAVTEAVRRLGLYRSDDIAPAGSSSYSLAVGPGLTLESSQPATWKARAIHYSGAADLLRPYRTVSAL